MTALNPSRDWDWDKETQSRILMKLDEISCILVNTNRQKGTPRAKPGKQWQPDYVAEAKEQAAKDRAEKRRLSKEQLEAIKEFWKKRNPEAQFVETT